MVTLFGPLATISYQPRQARKGATVVVTSCAGVWLDWVATLTVPSAFSVSPLPVQLLFENAQSIPILLSRSCKTFTSLAITPKLASGTTLAKTFRLLG